jgi:hypothetical protein
MVVKSETVELKPRVVIQGGSLTLTANLSDLELESIKAEGGILEFVVDGKRLSENPRDPKSTTLQTEGLKPGRHAVKVKLTIGKKKIAAGEVVIYVVKSS